MYSKNQCIAIQFKNTKILVGTHQNKVEASVTLAAEDDYSDRRIASAQIDGLRLT